MKKILLFVILALTFQTIKAQADAFITTWVTATGFETLTLAAQPDAPNYTINWGDGFTNTYTATQVPSHTFINSGEHTVSFTGTFPHLTFSGQSKLKSVQQWGTQKWTSMAHMFENCTTFNSFPNQAPDLTLCTDMSYMFSGATAFNQPIGSWNVSNVTNMSNMFGGNDGGIAFNQPIGLWNVSRVTNMSNMFSFARSFNQPIENWNVSQVTDMGFVFFNATAFNQPIGSWNVSKITNMSGMFISASSFNQPINFWDVISVKKMSQMFQNASSFNQPIDSWNVSQVTDMSNMFAHSSSFNQPLGSWNVSNVINMSWMFGSQLNDTPFNQDIGSWNINNVANMSGMFYGAKLSTANYDALLIGWASKGINGGILKQGVTFSGGSSNYCNASAARNYLINTYGWVITDSGADCRVTEVTIGTQTWTTTNLDITTYSDGTVIPQVTDHNSWGNLTTGGWCYYNNEQLNGTTYGKLYNWYAVAGIWNEASKTDVSQRKKLAPAGYHIPSDTEWTTLTDFLGTNAGGKMKAATLWNSPNTNANNESGFTALPGGYRSNFSMFPDSLGKGNEAWFWSSSEYDTTNAWFRFIDNNNENVFRESYDFSKIFGFSVRCVKDNALSNVKFENNSFIIYPNPVKDIVTIDCGNISNLAYQPYTITDALGKIVLKGKLNEGDTSINVEHLSKGIYYIKAANNRTSKFIKD